MTYLTNSGDINVCVVEEEEVDRATDADAVLTQRVVVFALRSKNALLLFGSCKKIENFDKDKKIHRILRLECLYVKKTLLLWAHFDS